MIEGDRNLPHENGLDELFKRYEYQKKELKARLHEFTLVRQEDYFYELCFCMCTPQSKARHALVVVDKLKSMQFQTHPRDVSDVLGSREHYIRFHNQKSKNLQAMQGSWEQINHILQDRTTVFEKRDLLAATIRGIGMKEASHFLRNIGIFGVAILDRHILKHLKQLDITEDYPQSLTRGVYLDIEEKWSIFCTKVGIPLEEMDLLFWSMETGEILK